MFHAEIRFDRTKRELIVVSHGFLPRTYCQRFQIGDLRAVGFRDARSGVFSGGHAKLYLLYHSRSPEVLTLLSNEPVQEAATIIGNAIGVDIVQV